MSKNLDNTIIGILAGGNGSRMSKDLPKPLREISSNHTLLSLAIQHAKLVFPNSKIIINGGCESIYDQIERYTNKVLRPRFENSDIEIIKNTQKPNGTGQGVETLFNHYNIANLDASLMLLYADVPSDEKSLKSIKEAFKNQENSLGIFGAFKTKNPIGKGRIILNRQSLIEKIIEEKDCNDKERAIDLVNAGFGLFTHQALKLYFDQHNQGLYTYENEWPFTNIPKILSNQRQKFGYVTLDENPLNYGANTLEELETLIKYYTNN